MNIRRQKSTNKSANGRLSAAGQALVETALVLPIILFLVLGVFELGRIVFIFSAVNNASREAARFGAATGAIGSGPRYLNCAAIREVARDKAFLSGLTDADIEIGYDTPGSGAMVGTYRCGEADLEVNDIVLGDRIVVTVTRRIDPILPFLPSFEPTFVTARTILKDIVIGPVECNDGLDNDGDGRADFGNPFDPTINDDGCESFDDTTEAFCHRFTLFGEPTEGGNLSYNPTFNCANRYIEGTVVELDASPAERYAFHYWEWDGVQQDTSEHSSVTMSADRDVIAHFRLLTSDLNVTKTAPATVYSERPLTYRISVGNPYTDTARDLVVTDTLPTGVDYQGTWSSSHGSANCTETITDIEIVCRMPSLASPVTVTVDIEVIAPVANYISTTITNTVTASAFEFDPNPANNTATAVTTVEPMADLRVSKLGPTEIEAEQQFTYSITVDNWGPSTATDVTVTDVLPAQVSFVAAGDGNCSAPVGVPGATVTCLLEDMLRDTTRIVTFQVVAEGSPDDLAENQATATATEYDPDLSNNNSANTAAYQETTVYSADVAINKRPNTATARRDQTFIYYLDVGNAGPSSAPSVEVTDQLPPGMEYQRFEVSNLALSGTTCSLPDADRIITCQLGDLAAGTTGTIRIYVTPLVETGSEPLRNLATIQSARVDYNTLNNSDEVSTWVNAIVGLSVEKTGPESINHGQTLTYRVTVTNATGYSTATNVQVTDTLPPGLFTYVGTESVVGSWSCTAPANQQIVCTLGSYLIADQSASFDVVLRPREVGDFTNGATVTSNEQPSGVHATSDTHTTIVLPVLSITKSASATAVNEGDSFAYTITVANSGTFNATGVAVVDSLLNGIRGVSAVAPSGWTCSDPATTTTISCSPDSGTLPAGGNATLTINVIADAAGTFSNTASLNSVEEDHTSNIVETVVNPTFDLSLTLGAPTTVTAGTPFDYTVTVLNSGPSAVTNGHVEVVLGEGLGYDAQWTSSAWTCPTYDPALRQIDCDATGAIGEGSTTIHITVTPTATGSVTTSAGITADEIQFDTIPDNNNAQLTRTIQ